MVPGDFPAEASALKRDRTALQRLIDEISSPSRSLEVTGYNRAYNRHNR